MESHCGDIGSANCPRGRQIVGFANTPGGILTFSHLEILAPSAKYGVEAGVGTAQMKKGELKRISLTLEEEAEIAAITNRLKRAHGQLGAIVRMIETGRGCEEIIHQIAAVSKAINTAAFTLISSSLKECLHSEEENSAEVAEKLKKLFLSLA